MRNNECDKAVEKLRYAQHHYKDRRGQRVNVLIQNDDAPYTYFLKSADNPPYIRFIVQGRFGMTFIIIPD